MFERFTDRSRKVVAMANQEANRRGYGAIDTEHILLTMTIEGGGVGAAVLRGLPSGLSKVRDEVERGLNPAVSAAGGEKLPQTRHAKNVIMYAIEESRLMNHDYVGTEHLLLGLLRVTDGKASLMLTKLGVSIEQARSDVLEMLRLSDAPLSAIISPASPAHISYRSNLDVVGGPSFLHILAGIFFGALFLATLSLVMVVAIFVLKDMALFGASIARDAAVMVPICCICLWACWILLRITIRQFSRRPIFGSRANTTEDE